MTFLVGTLWRIPLETTEENTILEQMEARVLQPLICLFFGDSLEACETPEFFSTQPFKPTFDRWLALDMPERIQLCSRAKS